MRPFFLHSHVAKTIGESLGPRLELIIKSGQNQGMMMRNRKGHVQSMLSTGALLLVCVGCVTGKQRFCERTELNSITYPPKRVLIEMVKNQTDRKILIEVVDKRTSTSVWTFPCAMMASWIPLVPCCPYKMEDLLLGCPYGLDKEIGFAAKAHFDNNRLAHATLTECTDFDYRMVIEVNYCAEKGCWTLYGGGIFPLGCWFAIMGAPFKYGSNLIDADVAVFGKDGSKVYQKHFYENTFYCSGEYYNLNPLTFLGSGLCRIMNDVSRDLSDIIK